MHWLIKHRLTTQYAQGYWIGLEWASTGTKLDAGSSLSSLDTKETCLNRVVKVPHAQANTPTCLNRINLPFPVYLCFLIFIHFHGFLCLSFLSPFFINLAVAVPIMPIKVFFLPHVWKIHHEVYSRVVLEVANHRAPSLRALPLTACGTYLYMSYGLAWFWSI